MRNIIFSLLSLFLLASCNNFLPPQPTKPNANDLKTEEQNVKLEANFESIKSNLIDRKCLSCHKPGGKGDEVLLETQEQIMNGTVDEKPLVVPGKAAESILYLVLVEDENLRGDLEKMPPPKAIEQRKAKAVTQQEIDIVAAWINGSAKKVEPQADKAVSEKTPVAEKQPVAAELPAKEQPAMGKTTDETQVVINYEYVKTQILEKKCLKCHKPGGKSEDLDFSSKENIIQATTDVGESIVVVNKPESSLLYLSLLPNKEDRKGAKKMPSAKAIKAGDVEDITPEETKIIEAWIKQGAP